MHAHCLIAIPNIKGHRLDVYSLSQERMVESEVIEVRDERAYLRMVGTTLLWQSIFEMALRCISTNNGFIDS
ncbi:hypothetical protein [Tunicatimonas sp.]|uniref:hypothetical protein n=1 Tax=Tunicatimonas sp. TaxID=1940096 RepID=UPI003C748E44